MTVYVTDEHTRKHTRSGHSRTKDHSFTASHRVEQSVKQLVGATESVDSAVAIETEVVVTSVVTTVVLNATDTAHTSDRSSDTPSYLDISTFIATGLSTSATRLRDPTELGSSYSHHLHSESTTAVGTTTATMRQPTGNTGGYPGAITSTVGASASASFSTTFEIGGLPIPVMLVVAMALCFGLALLL